MVLCAANSYLQNYYLDPACEKLLPESIQNELKIMCVTFVEDVGGILSVVLDDETGEVSLEVRSDERDYLFDEIGSELKIKHLQTHRRELFEQLETFYRVFYLKQEEGL